MNESDAMVFQIQKMAKDLEEKLTEDEKTLINELAEDLKKTREAGEVKDIEGKMQEVSEKLSEITTRIYSQASAEPTDPKEESSEKPEDVEDVEVEEVK
jgi:molecular chaperone DnaK